jgi:hypothetical protein
MHTPTGCTALSYFLPAIMPFGAVVPYGMIVSDSLTFHHKYESAAKFWGTIGITVWAVDLLVVLLNLFMGSMLLPFAYLFGSYVYHLIIVYCVVPTYIRCYCPKYVRDPGGLVTQPGDWAAGLSVFELEAIEAVQGAAAANAAGKRAPERARKGRGTGGGGGGGGGSRHKGYAKHSDPEGADLLGAELDSASDSDSEMDPNPGLDRDRDPDPYPSYGHRGGPSRHRRLSLSPRRSPPVDVLGNAQEVRESRALGNYLARAGDVYRDILAAPAQWAQPDLVAPPRPVAGPAVVSPTRRQPPAQKSRGGGGGGGACFFEDDALAAESPPRVVKPARHSPGALDGRGVFTSLHK